LKYVEKLCGEKSLQGFSFSFLQLKEKGKAAMALP
jgi:hypothetical protein